MKLIKSAAVLTTLAAVGTMTASAELKITADTPRAPRQHGGDRRQGYLSPDPSIRPTDRNQDELGPSTRVWRAFWLKAGPLLLPHWRG